MKVTTFGLDLAKRVFQLHWVDMETGEICRRQLKRAEMAEFFARREPSVVAMRCFRGRAAPADDLRDRQLREARWIDVVLSQHL